RDLQRRAALPPARRRRGRPFLRRESLRRDAGRCAAGRDRAQAPPVAVARREREPLPHVAAAVLPERRDDGGDRGDDEFDAGHDARVPAQVPEARARRLPGPDGERLTWTSTSPKTSSRCTLSAQMPSRPNGEERSTGTSLRASPAARRATSS